MFNKPIFKQSIRSNGTLWLIITLVGSALLSIFILTFDAASFSSLASAAEGTAFSHILSGMTSLLGTLRTFYEKLALLLGIVYVLFTANNLIVNEVDSGSMAYTLSTPIKRSSVIFTKMVYMVTSIILMFTTIAGVGLGVSELKHHNVSGYAITEDVRSAADALDRSPRYVSEHLYMIQDDKYALKAGADARDMDTEAYTKYLNETIWDHSYDKAAKELTKDRKEQYKDDDDMEWKDIEITASELEKNPSLMLNSNDALTAGAEVMGVSASEYRQKVAAKVQELEAAKANPTPALPDNASLLLSTAIEVGAKALNTEKSTIQDNLSLLKEDAALHAAAEATQLTPDQLKLMIDATSVQAAVTEDKALDFEVDTYLWLNLGICLLILALGSISFFASSYFNRTGAAMALGGGIPFAFFLISMIVEQSDNLENLKYLTLTTLYNTKDILAGGEFTYQFLALGGIAIVLYGLSNVVFCKKDLPL